jgi:hypothetical protein
MPDTAAAGARGGFKPSARAAENLHRVWLAHKVLREYLGGYAADPRAWRLPFINEAARALAEAVAAAVALPEEQGAHGGALGLAGHAGGGDCR